MASRCPDEKVAEALNRGEGPVAAEAIAPDDGPITYEGHEGGVRVCTPELLAGRTLAVTLEAALAAKQGKAGFTDGRPRDPCGPASQWADSPLGSDQCSRVPLLAGASDGSLQYSLSREEAEMLVKNRLRYSSSCALIDRTQSDPERAGIRW